MNNFRIVTQLVKRDIRNPRYYLRLTLCFFIVFAHYTLFMDQQLAFARELGLRINALEPFLYLLTHNFNSILILGSLFYLVSDAPFRDKGDYNAIYRVGRIRWLFAKIIVLLYFVMLYILGCFLASLFFVLPAVEFGFSYSKFVLQPIIPGLNDHKTLRLVGILDKYSLGQAAFRSSLIFFLWSTILSLIILNSNMKYKRAYGVSMAFIIPVGDRILWAVTNYRASYLAYLRLEYLDKTDWPITIAVMTAAVLVLIFLALVQVGSHSMHEKE